MNVRSGGCRAEVCGCNPVISRHALICILEKFCKQKFVKIYQGSSNITEFGCKFGRRRTSCSDLRFSWVVLQASLGTGRLARTVPRSCIAPLDARFTRLLKKCISEHFFGSGENFRPEATGQNFRQSTNSNHYSAE